MGRPIEEIDRDLRKRIVALARERGEREEAVRYIDDQLSMGNRGPAETEALLHDRQQNHQEVVAIIREMDEIHAERVRLGLAS